LCFYCFNTFADPNNTNPSNTNSNNTDPYNISLWSIDRLKKELEDKDAVNCPTGNTLSHLGKRSFIPYYDWPYLKLVLNIDKAYPLKFGVIIRLTLVEKLIPYDEIIEILLPIVDEAKKRSVFWEYCSHWMFREAYSDELEGLILLTRFCIESHNIDKALDILKVIAQCYPFRKETVESFLLFKFKGGLIRLNEEQESKFYQLVKNQRILMESKMWEELKLSKEGYKWLKSVEKLLLLSEKVKKIKEKPISVKFYKFEYKVRKCPKESYIVLIAKVLPNSALVTCSFKWEIDGSYKVDKVFKNFVMIRKESLKNKIVKLIIKDNKNRVIEKEYNLETGTIK